MRDHKTVIGAILATLGEYCDHIGLSMEPIASMTDPEDKIDADFQIRVMFELPNDENKFFATAFSAGINMHRFKTMTDDDFVFNMRHLITEFEKHRKHCLDTVGDATVHLALGKYGYVQTGDDPSDRRAGSISEAVRQVLDEKVKT